MGIPSHANLLGVARRDLRTLSLTAPCVYISLVQLKIELLIVNPYAAGCYIYNTKLCKKADKNTAMSLWVLFKEYSVRTI